MANDLNILICYHQSELVIFRKPSVDYEESLLCLTTKQVRCNECFIGKNRYTGFCWFVSIDSDSVGHATLMNQLRTLAMPKTKNYLPDLLLFVIGVCGNICWLLLQLECHKLTRCMEYCLGCSQSAMLSLIVCIHLNKTFHYICYSDSNGGRQCKNLVSVSKIYLIYCSYNVIFQTKNIWADGMK